MANPWSVYTEVVVETYEAVKPGKSSRVHARPIEGQPYPATWDVECSRAMRQQHPIGTRFRIFAKETNREGGKPFLYTHYSWPYQIVE
jgi:hypothetical protein